MIKPTPKRKYTRHSQQVYQEEHEVSTTEVVEKLRATEGEEPEEITSTREVVGVDELREEKQQLEEEELTNEEETEEQEEALVEDTALKGISTEPPDTADSALSKKNMDAIDDSEEEQKGEEMETSEIRDKQEVSDDEVKAPPVLQRRSLSGKQKVTPEPESPKGSKGQQEEHTDEVDLEAGGSASEETPDEKATDKHIGEHHLVQPEDIVDKAQEISTDELSAVQENTIAEEAAEDVIPSTEVNMEECKEVLEDKNAETASATEADEEHEANDIQELDIATPASETVMPGKVVDDAALPVAKKPASEIPKLMKASVILVDLKTSSHQQSVEEAEETPSDGERAAGKELMIASEENEASNCDAKEQTPEPEKTENSPEESVDLEAEIVEKEELEENKECASMEKGEGDSLLVETKVLRSGKKILTASSQQQEDSIAEKVDEAEIDGKENLILGGVDEEMSCEEEEAPVETRALRSVTKIVTATPRQKTTRSRKQVDKQEAENSEEEPAVTTRRPGKQIQEKEQKGIEESKSVEETGEEEEAGKRAAAENAATEREEENDEEMGDKEAVSQREENLEPEINPEAGRAVAEEGQDVVEDQSEAISKTVEQPDVETSGEECDETQPTMGDEEVEPSPVALMRSQASGGKTGQGSAEEPPTEGDERKAPKEEEVEVENEERDAVEVDKGVYDKGPITVTEEEEEEETAGLTAVTDDVVQEDTLSPKLTGLARSEDEATVSAEEQCSKEMVPKLSDLQRVTVVLVDLKNSHHDIHKEMATVDQHVPVEMTAPEEEDKQKEERMKDEKQMAKEHVPGSHFGVEKTELEKVAEEGFSDKVEDEETAKEDEVETRPLRSGENTVRDATKSKTTKTEAEEEAGEKSTEERRVLRKGRRSAAATPRRKSKRARTLYQPVEEEESTSSDEIHVEEPQAHENVEENDKELIAQKEENTESEAERTPTDVEEHKADEKEDSGDEMMEEKDVEEPVVQKEENTEPEAESTPTDVEEHKADEKEDSGDEMMEEKDVEEPVVQKEENSLSEVEMQKVEVVVEESVTGQETVEEEQSEAEMKKIDDEEKMKDASTEEAAVLEKEDIDETYTDMVEAEGMNSAQEKETTASEISTEVVTHTAFAEEEAIAADEPVATEETPAVTRTHPEKEKAQEPNDSLPEKEEGNLKEPAETDETSPIEDNAEAEEMPAASITRGKQREQSSNEENIMENTGAVESTSEEGNVTDLVLDIDREVETKVSSQKIEEVEQNTSDEEVEPIVIGKRVLRGRTVPSVMITPRSQTIRRSSKVQILEESLSDEDESPASAQRRRLRKRKSTGVTPSRKSKPHTRV